MFTIIMSIIGLTYIGEQKINNSNIKIPTIALIFPFFFIDLRSVTNKKYTKVILIPALACKTILNTVLNISEKCHQKVDQNDIMILLHGISLMGFLQL